MNNSPNDPKKPDPTNAAWEDAMTRDFDARVRDLHEAPLDIGSVKGKAHQIRRNRRAAVAGGILGVAAILTPIAVLANGDNTDSKEPPFVEDPTPSETVADPTTSEPDYVLNGMWHQADGDVVELDRSYDSAVLWGSQLVATYFDGEVFLNAEVIDEAGTVVQTFPTTSPVVVNDAGTTIAWVGTDGKVMTDGPGGELSLGTVDLAASGEGVAWSVAAITGGPDCNEKADGCLVYLNSGLGDAPRVLDSHGINDIAADGAKKIFDATADGAVSIITDVDDFGDTCGGIYDTVDGTIRWNTCDYQVQQFSPDGRYFLGTQSQYDSVGPSRIAIVDAVDGTTELNSFEKDGWAVGSWTWSADGSVVFAAVEGTTWQLMRMTTDGEISEIGKPVQGQDFISPFTLIQH